MVECGKCGTKLTNNDKECPLCHSTMKKHSLELSNGIVATVSELKVKQKDSSGFVKVEAMSRRKKGIESGRPSKEELVYDHTNEKITTKTHKVWELNERGELEKVHDERIDYPAKHRKPKSASK